MNNTIPMEKMPIEFVGKNIFMANIREIIEPECGGIIIPNDYQIYTAENNEEIMDIKCIIVDEHQQWPNKFCAITQGKKDKDYKNIWCDFPFVVRKRTSSKITLSESDWSSIDQSLIVTNLHRIS